MGLIEGKPIDCQGITEGNGLNLRNLCNTD
jgi:hypothetical protein